MEKFIKIIYVSLAIVFLISLSGCNEDSVGEAWEEVAANDPEWQGEYYLRNGGKPLPLLPNAEFAFNLLKNIAVEENGANLFISPISANIALSILTNGAGGQTLTESKSALGYGDLSVTEMNEYLSGVQSTPLPSDKDDPVVDFAGGIWFDHTLPLKPGFTEAIKTYYQAEPENVVFADLATFEAINKWTSDKTRGRIPRIVEFSQDMVGCIVNTLYFNGKWATPFRPEMTASEAFINADGTKTSTPTMQSRQITFVYRGTSFSMLELCYAAALSVSDKRPNYSMMLILPNDNVPLSSVLDALTPEAFNIVQSKMALYDATVKLPKFTVSYGSELTDILAGLGMPTMFSSPDLSALSEKSFVLSGLKVIQKAFASIDENGTEATSATAVSMFTESAGTSYPHVNFFVNRPFLFFIQENNTGQILFSGKIEKL
ncbi:MAG: serpin family protein [Tannerellaceae bacterium]|jgi:serpin B|nr:serpin family protein [Tannerellaceae bacterium]